MTDILDAAERYIQDTGLTGTYNPADEDKTRAVDDALREYSAVRPRDVVATATVTGDVTVDLTTLTGWGAGWSIVAAVWADWSGAWADVLKTPQNPDSWDTIVHPVDGKEYLFWKDSAPAAAGTIGIKYSGVHVESSVPLVHRQAVGKLAASNMCLIMSAHYAEASKSSIGTDSFLGSTQSTQWRDLARDLRKQYMEATGAGGSGSSGSGAEFASATAGPDRDKLTGHGHGRLVHDNKDLD